MARGVHGREPVTRYRWLLSGGAAGYAWLNGLGALRHDVPDADDFVLTIDPGGPDWHLGSVVYEIFPDRFASAARGRGAGLGGARGWDERRGPRTRHAVRVLRRRPRRDRAAARPHRVARRERALPDAVLPGRQHPPLRREHFDRVDPLLGGDEALASLARAAHARGIRIIGDLTLNHSGAGHEWFSRAGRPARPSATSTSTRRSRTATRPGSASRRCRSSTGARPSCAAAMRRRRAAGSTAVGLDGWRIDVANMTGRYRDVDLTGEVGPGRPRRARRASRRCSSPSTATTSAHDLAGGGWHGTMNYAGFLRPVWAWLRGDELPGELGAASRDAGRPAAPRRPSRDRDDARVPRRRPVAVGRSTPGRCSTATTPRASAPSPARASATLVGIGLQMTTPGVPMVFAGDELGLEGDWGEDARRTMPWDRPESWDADLLASYRA